MKLPLFAIFKREYRYNTLTACLWMACAFCVYYSIWALFSTYLQKELQLDAASWWRRRCSGPTSWSSPAAACGASWPTNGAAGSAIIVPAILAIFVTPLYLWNPGPVLIIGGFILQGIFGGSIYGQNPSYLSERFPTEVRATASGFVYHQGAIWGGLIAPVLTYFAVQMKMGFAMPMMIQHDDLPGRASSSPCCWGRRRRARN